MKKIVFAFCLLLISYNCSTQNIVTFNNTYSDTLFFSSGCNDAIETDSFYYVSTSGVGNFMDGNLGTFVRVYKIDKLGFEHKGYNLIYPNKDFVTFTKMIKSKNNDGFYLAQPYIVDSNFVPNGFFSLIKLDNNLAQQWQFVLQDSLGGNLPFEIFEQNNKLYLFGTSDDIQSYTVPRLILIDINGEFVNSFSYPDPDGDLIPYRGCLLSSGNILMGGATSKFGNLRGCLLKFDSLGNLLQTIYYPNTYSLGVRNFGDAYALMYGYTVLNNVSKGILQKIDTNGIDIWRKTINYGSGLMFNGAKVFSNNTIVAVGTTRIPNTNNAGYIGCFDGDGNTLWQRTYINPGNIAMEVDQMSDVIETTDGGILINGAAEGTTGQDLWLVKLDSMGCLEPNCWVGIEDVQQNNLGVQIYPNPVTDWLNIKVPLEKGNVQLEIYNLTGHLVAAFTLNAPINYLQVGHLSKGLHLLKFLRDDGAVEVERTILGN